mgnify:CR=1 FL=1
MMIETDLQIIAIVVVAVFAVTAVMAAVWAERRASAKGCVWAFAVRKDGMGQERIDVSSCRLFKGSEESVQNAVDSYVEGVKKLSGYQYVITANPQTVMALLNGYIDLR